MHDRCAVSPISASARFVGILLALLVCVSCGDADKPSSSSVHEPFAPFAQSVFTELQSQPIAQDRDIEIGLFGDLDVMPGEHVVMGRYRYRVDTLDGQVTGHMAFLLRNASGDGAIPAVLSFTSAQHQWHLADAELHAPQRTSDSLQAFIEAHFDPWVTKAVQRAAD